MLGVHFLKVAVGTVVILKRPHNPVGWLLMLMGTGFFLYPSAVVLQAWVAGAAPNSDWGRVLEFIDSYLWLTTYAAATWMLLLFSNGRLLSPRWRWPARMTAAVYITIAAALALTSLEVAPKLDNMFRPTMISGGLLGAVLLASLVGVILLAFASFLVRLYISRGVQALQLKWAGAGFAVTVAWVLTSVALPPASEHVAVRWAGGLASLPNTVAIAMLRYCLYDTDVVINRALVYTALTVTLGLVYLGAVVGLQKAFRTLTGQESQLAVVASALAIVALFIPLRRRIQGFVVHRFYRKKYDAQKMLEAFSAKLRDETDLDALRSD